MNRIRIVALVLAIGVVPLAIGVFFLARDSREYSHAALDTALAGQSRTHAAALDDYFRRARSTILLAAQESAFAKFYESDGGRVAKIRSGGPVVDKLNGALAYLERLYPGAIGEACVIDGTGAEAGRVVRGARAPLTDLSTLEEKTPFFAPTFALRPGEVYQARPYVSPDTDEWVISNSTPIPARSGRQRAILHFEVTVESFRRAAAERSPGFEISVVDARTGAVVLDSRHAQVVGPKLGRLGDSRFSALRGEGAFAGYLDVAGGRGAFRRVSRTKGNANEWYVVATAPSVSGPALGGSVVLLAALTLATLVLLGLAFATRWQRAREAALVDSLTGLRNHRAFREGLEELARRGRSASLVIVDLDGLKEVNDQQGHPAGDARLRGLADALREEAPSDAGGYRVGGDEFALLLPERSGWEAFKHAQALQHALLQLEGITATAGVAESDEDATGDELVRRADLALITAKRAGQSALRYSSMLEHAARHGEPDAEHQSKLAVALARAVDAKDSYTRSHCETVAELCAMIATELGLAPDRVAKLRLGGLVHDVGKIGVPDAILQKPSRLDPDEFEVMKTHSPLGHKILVGTEQAPWVLHHHERIDGGGYPAGLHGDEIPLEARIIHVADAFEAMTSDRPYRQGMPESWAIEELRRHAGAQFDRDSVSALLRALERAPHATDQELVAGVGSPA
ncbi:MAG: HD domain-containing phosphohydrolase [Actinomycetota bacterium]